MNCVKQLVVAMAISLLAVSLSQSQQQGVSTNSCKMVQRALAAYSQLKPGMTRAEVETDFGQEGGIFTRRSVRYAYKECMYIKLAVEYTPDPNQAKGLRSPRDVVRSLSGLTIAHPVTD